MDNKKADNEILELRNKINSLDNKLDFEKKNLKKLDKMQEEIDELSKSIDRCISLLTQSIKGKSTNNFFDDMSDRNTVLHTKTTNTIQVETEDTQKRINKLYNEKENIIKEERNKYQKEKE